jgi:hypothetical protein
MNAMPAAAKPKKELAALVLKHQKTIERAKQLYDRADNLLAQIVAPFLETCKHCGSKVLKKDAVIVLNDDGKTAELLDNFADHTVVWGHGGVRHFGVKVSKS